MTICFGSEFVHVNVVVIVVIRTCLAKAKAPTTKFWLGTATPTYRTAAPPRRPVYHIRQHGQPTH